MTQIICKSGEGREMNPFLRLIPRSEKYSHELMVNPDSTLFHESHSPLDCLTASGEVVSDYRGEAELVWQFKIPAIELWRTVEKVTYDRFVNFDDYEKHYNERDLQCRQIFIITEPEKSSEPILNPYTDSQPL